MSLNATLDVNGRVIGRITMRRITNTKVLYPDPDCESIYEVKQFDEREQLIWATTVKHCYGDGAEALLHTSLNAILLT